MFDLKELLEQKVIQYNQREFIDNDPISIPHMFSKKEDIEISALLSATIAWGNRKMIINNAKKIIEYLDNSPYDFIVNHSEIDTKHWKGSIHRTFNTEDLKFFCNGLKDIYINYSGLEEVFKTDIKDKNPKKSIENFRSIMLKNIHEKRSEKHIASPNKGSAAKRINMFLRWMVRNDGIVDFGIWKSISPAQLSIPIDIHSGRTAFRLGLISKEKFNWKTLEELDENLRIFDPSDPAKYDFALFGIGINNDF